MVLHNYLCSIDRTASEFYDGVIEHGIRHWRLLEEKSLMNKLSPTQRENLGVEWCPENARLSEPFRIPQSSYLGGLGLKF